jgi:hypothetical protein
MKLGLLEIDTIFTFNGMTLRKGSTTGPCSRETNKAVFPSKEQAKHTALVIGAACSPKMGGQFQKAEELQVWVPHDTDVVCR